LSQRPQNLGEQLKVGARWSSAQVLLNLPVRLGTLAVLARLLTPSEFGIFAAAVTVIEFARPLSTLSMDQALVQSKSLANEGLAFASALAVGLSSLVAALVVLNASMVLLVYDDPGVPPLLAGLALSLPLGAVSSLLLAALRRRLVFRELSIIVLISTTLASLASVIAALAGLGVWALAIGYYTELALRALLALFLVRPRVRWPRIGEDARGLLRFGIGSTLSLSLNFWALHGDYVVIGSALGPKPLGYYSRAYQLISTVPGMLNQLHQMVLFPAFSRAQTDRAYLRRALRAGTEATAALTLPLCAWGLVLGPELIAVLLGPGWEAAVLPFQILSLGVYFRSAYGLSASIVFATGHVFSLSACQGIYGLLIVVGALLGTAWGIAGVAIATVVALLAFYLLLYLLAARVSGASMRSFLVAHARPAIVFAIVLGTAMLGRSILAELESPPIMTLVATVSFGVLALGGATRMLGRRLWGDLLYQQGLAGLGRRAPATALERQGRDDTGG
jgi:PST family polysaccharide transporter